MKGFAQENNQQQLVEKYNTLPLLHQRILQIRALTLCLKCGADFVNCLMRVKLGEKTLKKAELKSILNDLIKNDFLLDNYSLNCELFHRISVLATIESNPYAKRNIAIVKKIIGKNDYLDIFSDDAIQKQLVHFAIYTNDITLFLTLRMGDIDYGVVLLAIISELTYLGWSDLAWVKTRHPMIQVYICCVSLMIIHDGIGMSPDFAPQWFDFYRSEYFVNSIDEVKDCLPLCLQRKFLEIDLNMGLCKKVQAASELLPEDNICRQEAMGALAFLRNDFSVAVRCYNRSVKFDDLVGRQLWLESNIHDFFYVFAQIQAKNYQRARKIIDAMNGFYNGRIISLVLIVLLELKQENIDVARDTLQKANIVMQQREGSISELLFALFGWCVYLVEPQEMKANIIEYKNRFLRCCKISHYLLAHLYAELVLIADSNDADCLSFLEKGTPFGELRFLQLLRLKQPWEYAVDKLHRVVADQNMLARKARSKLSIERVIWLLNPIDMTIDVAVQKQLKNGNWSSGRVLSWNQLKTADTKIGCLTDQDLAAMKGLRFRSRWFYEPSGCSWNLRKTLHALIGHPLVFHVHSRYINLELVKGELELQVEKVANGYHLSLAKHSKEPCVFLEQETSTRYRVIDFSDDYVAISQIVSEQGLTVPFVAKDKVVDIICNAKSNISINSDVGNSIPEVVGDATCWVHLFPVGDGIKLNIWMRPFGDKGGCYLAAHGQKNVIATITTEKGGKLKQKALRDFAQEKTSVQSLIDSCTTLAELSGEDTHCHEWYLDSIPTCLEVLLELEEYKKERALNIEWPKGQTLKLKQKVSYKNLSVSVRENRDWFAYDGEIKLDQGLAVDMKKLLDLFDSEYDYGRFIKLADGEFLALTENLKKHLAELKTISEDNKVYRLSTGILRELADNAVQINGDNSWYEHINKLKSMEKHDPVVPSTLQADLREYQITGFKYLSRLARWGIGACLADDMGVGKTVQAITLLLELAPLGPVLVVAPTSVCFIWLEELAKFAPALNVHVLNKVAERQTLVGSLDKMDVLICSYGLLHQNENIMLAKEWQVVILDEAQAIKNYETKRWKCATQLKSDCRVVLTGTPIENHLGELWSIFRFLNPGLLGNLKSFQGRYATPIEKYRDSTAKRALKNLVKPYILRRTKTEVLQELPPKIEQSILIEPTAEEIAFYEAVRAKALERVQCLEQGGAKRFGILAEITRLRQACCHSSLVDTNVNIASSKVKMFLRLVNNLNENKHKALVFSQYVRYLTKIRQLLEQENITYQYLDGATPAQKRQEAVTAFQAGAGDLFLISLKAGGAGLNLTAADYVIILDPWWNPAVEAQASDRAHRIGQQRPVTVYRLIMRNSIEEKIIKLHQDKKDLADDLLSGSDISGKITEEELLRLMEV